MRKSDSKKNIPDIIPIIPVTDTVLFPKMVSPLIIKSSAKDIIEDLKQKKKSERMIGLLQSKDENTFHNVGTVALVLDVMDGKDGSMKLSLQGVSRFKPEFFIDDPYLKAQIGVVEDINTWDKTTTERIPAAIALFSELAVVDVSISKEMGAIESSIKNPAKITDMIA
jgi:ATP-dependent Lon protease